LYYIFSDFDILKNFISLYKFISTVEGYVIHLK